MITNKKLKLLAGCFLATLLSSAQPTFQWAKQMAVFGSDAPSSIVTDNAGNVYTTGYFQGTVDFDPGVGVFNMTAIAGSQLQDIFISKLDPNGNLLWAKQIGGSGYDNGISLTVDNMQNVYVVGNFDGTVDFDPNAGVQSLISSAAARHFVLKLDVTGSFVWVKQIGGITWSITSDNTGAPYITGQFNITGDFDPGIGTLNLTPAGFVDGFVLKLNTSGDLVWVKQMGASGGTCAPYSIAIDAANNIYTTGGFFNTVDFDPGIGISNLASTSGSQDIFVSKIDVTGNFVWAKHFSSPIDEAPSSIKVDNTGNVLITGRFAYTVDFDPNVGVANLTALGTNYNSFITKLDASGNLIWAKALLGSAYNKGISIQNDINSDVYVGGTFVGTADFDPGIGTQNRTSFGIEDVFILKLDASGNFVWVQQIGGTSFDGTTGMTIDINGSIISTGYFTATCDFDPSVATFNMTAPDAADNVYVFKLSQCISPSTPANTTPLLNQTICSGLTTNLSASSSGTVTWYSTPTGTNVLASGTSYTTPVLSAGTYTYYAEASTCTISATRTAITVTVNSLPTISVNSGSICSGNSFTINPTGVSTYSISGGSAIVSPTTNASYNITGTSAQGCVSSNTAVSSVAVNSLPTITAITNNTLLCIGETTSLTASGASTYLWNTSATTSVIAISPTVTINYTVTGTDANGCINSSTITQSVSLCTGISATQSIDASLNVFPNPSNGLFTITGIEQNANISIYNTLGVLIKTLQTEKINTEIDLSDYSNGIYFIKLKNNNGEAIHKLIKQ
jgi:hypothetical protein